MTLTIEQLQAISPGSPEARLLTFIPHINEYCPKYGIDTEVEMASFLAQVLHESGGFRWMREIWGPTAQQNRYERDFNQEWSRTNPRNRLAFALGNSIKGDGKKFMGRGPIQITGRANYTRLSQDMFGDNRLLHTPDIIATPQYGIICLYLLEVEESG